MKDPVDHILRPRLPWRDSADITECGLTEANRVITRETYDRRLKDLGRQRTAMLTCMTCSDAATRWRDWNDDPRLALAREIEWERGTYYFRRHNDRGDRLRSELVAIEKLIGAHRQEFLSLVEIIERQREWLAKKAARVQRPKDREPSL
jgi:hypothetical protein